MSENICDALLVKVCSKVTDRPIYSCPGGEWIGNEVLLYDSENQLIPHGSTTYPVEDSGFVGNGSGFIASYFTNKAGAALAQASEPVDGEWSPDPNCGNTASDPMYLCFVDADGNTTPGYMICEPNGGGGSSVTCTPTALTSYGTGPGDGSYYGIGDPGSGIAGVTNFFKFTPANATILDAALAGGASFPQIVVDIDGTPIRFMAGDIIPPSDPANTTGVYLIRPTSPDPCGWRTLPGAEVNSTTTIDISANNAGVASGGSGSGQDCTYYDLDGNEIDPNDYASVDSNCDKFDFENVGVRCVKDTATGALLAQVDITKVWDIESANTTPFAVSYVDLATSSNFAFDPLTMFLDGCDVYEPHVEFGCMKQFNAAGDYTGCVEVYQSSPLLVSGMYDFENATYKDVNTGLPVVKGVNDIFRSGKCGVRCYTCAAA